MRFAAPRRVALPENGATGATGETEVIGVDALGPRETGPNASGVSASEILRICASLLVPGSSLSAASGPPSFDTLILFSIDPPESSGPGSLTFVGPKTPLRVRSVLRAGLILAEPGIDPVCAPTTTGESSAVPDGVVQGGSSPIAIALVTSVPAALSAILTALTDRLERTRPFAFGPGNRIAPTAVVEGCLEGNVTVGAGAFVGQGSYIGSGTRIEANAVIQEHCHIGRDCVIQSGAVIGCAGFGFFARRTGDPAGSAGPSRPSRPSVYGLEAVPHPAGVVLGDGCWIGANAVIAAGVLAPTRLGHGCKLDSHVQIAHNVRLGDGCLLASQSGIAGSTVAGDRLRMGGASSVDGHLRLGNDVSVAACSGVTKDVADGVTVAGFPARPIGEWRRQLAQRKSR